LNTTLVKFTNAEDANQPPGAFLEEGQNVFWEYVVTNDGNVTLTDLSVIDDQGVIVTCPKDTLAPDESMTCTASGEAVPGQYVNIGTVTGTAPVGPVVDASDISHYFGSAPDISIMKKLNGVQYTAETQPYLPVGAEITWTYEIANTGNVDLTDVVVTDDGVIICEELTLTAPPQAGSTYICEAPKDYAEEGEQQNEATVTGTPPVGSHVNASDTSFYFGADPAVELVFRVNGQDANTAPGLYVLEDSALTLHYAVENKGNVPLESLEVNRGAITVCTIENLAVGASDSCTDTITAQTGQQSVTATVTATPPGGLSPVTDSDPIYYFGATLELSLVKKTNEQLISEPTGMFVETGSPVEWTYELTNASNVTLTNITVVDDNGTPANNADDHTVCSGFTLNPGATHTCTWSQNAMEGAYSNTALATGVPPSPLTLFPSEPATSHYFGVTLDVSFLKETNGVYAKEGTGPLIGVGETVNWTYTVTNNSNVPLPFTIVDDPAVTISCEKYTLDPADAVVCTASGTAEAGQFANTATLTVTTPDGLDDLTLEDNSHYYGVVTGISIEKYTNGQNADVGPGPLIKVGETVTWRYEVTNTGNVTLNNVVIDDDQEGVIDCPSTLLKGATAVCTKTGTAVAGQYSNLATVTANPPDGFAAVTDSDPSHYFGSEAGITIMKLTNGLDTTPFILVGDPVEWTYVITNVGNVLIEDILVTDSDDELEITCPATVLDPGAFMTCSAAGFATIGEYSNTGYVEGTPEGFAEKVYASDSSAYFGAAPALTITKYTNGVDAKTPEESPYIPVGEPVEFLYEISSQETAYIFNEIEVMDDSGWVITCPTATLEPGDDPILCTAEGPAAPGQQALAGHVSASVIAQDSGEMFGTVHAEDFSHYFGYALGLDLVKLTNGQLVVEGSPGPELAVGGTVTWTYLVTNTSNVPITNIQVSDDPEGPIICPMTELGPAEGMTCSTTGTVDWGPYHNEAYASGLFDQEWVESFVAISYYHGTAGYMFFLPLIMR
jgi:hypothetical protein